MLIGIIAGNHAQFMEWLDEVILPTPTRIARNVREYPNDLTIIYVSSPDAARGIEFDLIIPTGRYADKWGTSQEEYDFLRQHNLRR